MKAALSANLHLYLEMITLLISCDFNVDQGGVKGRYHFVVFEITLIIHVLNGACDLHTEVADQVDS